MLYPTLNKATKEKIPDVDNSMIQQVIVINCIKMQHTVSLNCFINDSRESNLVLNSNRLACFTMNLTTFESQV